MAAGTPIAEARIEIVADFKKFFKDMDTLKKKVESAFGGAFVKELNNASRAVNKHGDAVLETGKKAKKTAQDMKTLTARVQEFGENMQKQMFRMHELGIGLLRIGAAFTAISVGAMTAFGKIEAGFLDVQKTTGMAGQELEDLEASILGLGKTMAGISVSSLQEIATVAGQLGVRGVQNITDLTETVAKLAVTTDLSAEIAATGLARLANVTNTPISQVERLGDVINELQNTTTATAGEIMNISTRMAGMATTAGFSVDQILGLSAALRDVGARVEIAGTSMVTVITNLLAKGAQIESVLGAPGKGLAEQMETNPFQGMMTFFEALMQYKPTSQAAILKEVGMSSPRVLSTIEQITNGYDKMGAALKTASEEMARGGSLVREYDIYSQGLNAQLQLLWNNITIAAAAAGDKLAPALKDVLSTITHTFQGMTNLVGAFPELTKTILALVAAIGALAIGAGSLLMVLPGLAVVAANWAWIMASLPPVLLGIVAAGTAAAYVMKRFSDSGKESERNMRILNGEADKLVDRYDELSKKASLSSTEQDELNRVVDEISSILPDASFEWDEYGNALPVERAAELAKNLEAVNKATSMASLSDLIKLFKESQKMRDMKKTLYSGNVQSPYISLDKNVKEYEINADKRARDTQLREMANTAYGAMSAGKSQFEIEHMINRSGMKNSDRNRFLDILRWTKFSKGGGLQGMLGSLFMLDPMTAMASMGGGGAKKNNLTYNPGGGATGGGGGASSKPWKDIESFKFSMMTRFANLIEDEKKKELELLRIKRDKAIAELKYQEPIVELLFQKAAVLQGMYELEKGDVEKKYAVIAEKDALKLSEKNSKRKEADLKEQISLQQRRDEEEANRQEATFSDNQAWFYHMREQRARYMTDERKGQELLAQIERERAKEAIKRSSTDADYIKKRYTDIDELYTMEMKRIAETFNKKKQLTAEEKRQRILDKGTFTEGWMLGMKEIEEEFKRFGERGFNAIYDMTQAMAGSFQTLFGDTLQGQLRSAEKYLLDFAQRVATVWTDMAANNVAGWVVSGVTNILKRGGATATAPDPTTMGGFGKMYAPSAVGASTQGTTVHLHMEGSTFMDRSTLESAVGVATEKAMLESYTSNKILRKVTR